MFPTKTIKYSRVLRFDYFIIEIVVLENNNKVTYIVIAQEFKKSIKSPKRNIQRKLLFLLESLS